MSGVEQREIAADDDGVRLDRWFQRHYPHIRFGQIAKLARTGQIRLDGKRVKPGDRLARGQTLRIPPLDIAAPPVAQSALSARDAAAMRALVLHEDRHLIALNKPAGLATQGGTGQGRHLDGLLSAFGTGEHKPRLVHRLDKDTSGVILVAKSAKVAATLAETLKQRAAEKTYWALVAGTPHPLAGTIRLRMAKREGHRGEQMQADEEGKSSVSHYQLVEALGKKASWLALRPVTGRTHQLRLHCAELGTPIIGDGKYGGERAFLGGLVADRLHLHARSLRLPHPAGGIFNVTAPLPEHMAQSWAALGLDEALGNDLDWDGAQ